MHFPKIKIKNEIDYVEMKFLIVTAVPIEAFRKMLISSFPRLEELLHGVPQHFKKVPQKSHNFLSRLANHINFFKTTDQSR